MTQKIPETTDILGQIRRKALKLPTPEDYFSGLDTQRNQALPTNLLLFDRRSAKALMDMKGMPMTVKLHSRSVLIVCLEGAGEVFIENTLYRLGEMEVLLISPYEVHAITQLQQKNVHWLLMTFDLQDEAMLTHSAERRIGKPKKDFWSLLHMLLISYSGEFEHKAEKLALLSGLILLELPKKDANDLAINEQQLAVSASGIYQCVRSFMRDQPPDLWSIGNIAAFCSLSPSRLRTRFREEMSMSMGSYLKYCRLLHAAKLLKATNKSLTEISEICGYETVYSFSRAFRSFFNLPPRQFRMRTVV